MLKQSWKLQATETPMSIKPGRLMQGQRGMTLIEILITVLVLAVGLLGMASLTVGSLKNNQGAFLRTQASILAYDIADRMRSNVTEAISGSYDGKTTASSYTAPACGADGCTGVQRVTADLLAWKQQMEGVNGNMAMLPGGVGTISGGAGATTAGNTFTVTITWSEDRWSDAADSMAVETQQTVVEFTL